jgi:hypothetical protein
MGRLFTSAGNDYLVSANTFTPGSLRTISMIVKVTAYGAADGRVYNWRDAGGNNETISYYHPAAADVLEYSPNFSTTNGNWTCPGPAAGTRSHGLITYDGGNVANNPNMYVGGVLQTATRTQAPVGTVSAANASLTLGQRFGGSGNKYAGTLEEFAMWNRILIAREIAALALGFSPLCFPRGLICYYRLPGRYSPELDLSPGASFGAATVTGTSAADHGRVFYPARPLLPYATADTSLAAAVTCSISTAGALTTSITMAGAGTCSLTAAGALTTQINMAGAVSCSLQATGALTTSITMAGAATASLSAAGSLTTGISLAAGASCTLTISANLATAISLAGGVTCSLTATGEIATAISLAGTAVCSIQADGALITEILLTGAGSCTVTVGADLSTGIALAGDVTCSISTTGDLVLSTEDLEQVVHLVLRFPVSIGRDLSMAATVHEALAFAATVSRDFDL